MTFLHGIAYLESGGYKSLRTKIIESSAEILHEVQRVEWRKKIQAWKIAPGYGCQKILWEPLTLSALTKLVKVGIHTVQKLAD
jgi:hypothetical protein